MFWKKKTILLSFVLTFFLAAMSLALSDSWTSKTDMPTARRSMGTAVLNGKIYVIGGSPGKTGGFKTVEVYDPSTDTWTTKSPMQLTRGDLGVSVVNGKIYAIGGGTSSSSPLNKVEEYDPATDTWTTKAPMPTRRFFLSTSVVNGKIYAIGGVGGWPNFTSAVEEYDPATDSWSVKTSMSTKRASLSTSVVNGKIYAIGGRSPGITPRVEEYDPVTNFWTRKADMPTPRAHLITSVLNNKIYVIGGATPDPDGPPVSIVEEYDPATDTWTTKADLPTARAHLASCTVNGRIYAIGGTTGGFPWPVVSIVEEYNPGLPPPDFNGDQKVDLEDLLRLIEYWGQDEPSLDLAPPLGDGIVDVQDLEFLMSHWRQEPDDPTLIAHWSFDETDGIIAKENINGNNAYIVGDATWQPAGGIVDGAVQLDGVDDCVVTGPIPDFSVGPLSVITWIKGGAPGQVILSQMGLGSWLCLDPSNGTLMTELKSAGQDGTSLISETVVTDNGWHRVGFVWDGFYRMLYVDGVPVAADTLETIQGSENPLYFGTDKTMQPGTYFSGLIDDLRIYNRVLIP